MLRYDCVLVELLGKRCIFRCFFKGLSTSICTCLYQKTHTNTFSVNSHLVTPHNTSFGREASVNWPNMFVKWSGWVHDAVRTALSSNHLKWFLSQYNSIMIFKGVKWCNFLFFFSLVCYVAVCACIRSAESQSSKSPTKGLILSKREGWSRPG